MSLEKAKLLDREKQIGRDVVNDDNGHTERLPWLMPTDWKTMFAGRDMAKMIKCVSTDVGEDQYEAIVKASVNRMIQRCLDGIKDLDTRGWDMIRFWLRSVDRNKAYSKPFR